MTEIGYKKRKWKPNPLVPPPKPKRPAIKLNYLENKRRSRGLDLDREQLKYKPNQWKTELKDRETQEKFDFIFDKAQQISSNENMQEQYLR